MQIILSSPITPNFVLHYDEPEEPTDLQTDVSDASSTINSTAVEGDDLGLSGYVQDSFDFLDQMDCSVLDHMEQYSSYQVCSSISLSYNKGSSTFTFVGSEKVRIMCVKFGYFWKKQQ